jgi:hypothetical protein
MTKKYIYICAAGHSGSTLLDLLLGSHSNVESLGEISQLPKNIALNTICMCGQPVRTCPLWANVFNSLGRKFGVDLISNPYALNLGFINAKVIVDKRHQNKFYNLKRKVSRAFDYGTLAFGSEFLRKLKLHGDRAIYNNICLYEEVMQFQKVSYIVDSSKDYLKAVKLYHSKPGKVKVIFLVRDGRGVFYSFLKRGFPKKESLNAWFNHNRRALKIIYRNIPIKDRLVVKYENLALQTIRELNRICFFLGLNYEKEMLNFLDQSHHIANGNNMRFATSSYIKLDVEWKKNLTASDIEYFKRIAGAVNQKLGYGKWQ